MSVHSCMVYIDRTTAEEIISKAGKNPVACSRIAKMNPDAIGQALRRGYIRKSVIELLKERRIDLTPAVITEEAWKNRQTKETKEIKVTPKPEQTTLFDTRTDMEKLIDAINALTEAVKEMKKC